MRCIRCHRPLKFATETGMGSTCARKAGAQAVPAHDRDLFGFEIHKAVEAAIYRLRIALSCAVVDAHMDLQMQFRKARERLLGWEVRP